MSDDAMSDEDMPDDPVGILCDAPPYPIVQACNVAGVEKPEDRRWEQYGTKDRSCHGKTLKLAGYRFTYASGEEVTCYLAQCPTCKTVFWRAG